MSRTPSALGNVQQKIPLLILPEEFGVNEQEVKDCLAGLKAHKELCQSRQDFSGWVRNRITDAMDAARAVGKAVREEREKGEAASTLAKQIDGLAKHFGMSPEAVELALAAVEPGAEPPKKAKRK